MYIECTEMAITEFILFVLTATLGGMFLCGANDLITIFVAPECFSLCSYLLSGYTKKDVRSNEATMKYLLMGGASSSILVHGFSWLYGLSGGEIELQEIVNGLINTQMYNSPGISIALIFITVGIGFKLSPAPSHQWTPDVYEGVRRIPFNQEGTGLDILSKWLAPSINLLHQKLRDSAGWYEFLKDATFSVSIAYFGIFLASFLYKPIYSSFKSFDLINSFIKIGPKRSYWDKIINVLYDWSYNRAYIDAFYTISFTGSIRGLAQLTHFFDRRIIDGIANGVGIMSFFVGEGIKYVGGGRISLVYPFQEFL
ncbi:hypothetical protein CASFOL_007680 [Castilleja foliolosa]|uniref:NAD(P)H-quinone oxidoreductase subunit 5, chloroplastic n=1 Tax=Castilleja foliolosa TaxID=1961234 RepID=A0ABD3E2B8_9LAMI